MALIEKISHSEKGEKSFLNKKLENKNNYKFYSN